MNLATEIISSFLVLSLAGNLFFLFRHKQIPKKRGQSVELQEFLVDLMGGYGVVAINRIDPQNILLRSPRAKT